jgi:hypothetical protein
VGTNDAGERLPPQYPTSVYVEKTKTLAQGDIGFGFFHQLKSASGSEAKQGPGDEELQSEDMPYFGPWRDYDLETQLPDGKDYRLKVRLWTGPFIVLHHNCEIAWCNADDTRLIIAPIVFRSQWPDGPWKAIRAGSKPGYFYLPTLTDEERERFGYKGDWDEAAVDFAGTTAYSKRLAQPTRAFRLSAHTLPLLQSSMVVASTVRGWASVSDSPAWYGKKIVAVQETSEWVPAPGRLTKIFLEDENGEADEAALVWGLRAPRKGE